MSNLLALRDESGDLLFPGIDFQQNRLVLPETLEPEKLRDLIRVLVTIDACSLWYWGDLLCWIKRNRGEEFAIEAAEQSDNSDRLFDAMIVADQFKTRSNLSYHHHRECLVETGRNPELALEWLAKAAAGGWTVAQMRREIRYSHSLKGLPMKNEPKGNSFSLTGDLSLFRKHLTSITVNHPIDEWSAGELEALRCDLEPIANLITELESRLQTVA
jgi:hypothetical protein